jgi:hypothetical protein
MREDRMDAPCSPDISGHRFDTNFKSGTKNWDWSIKEIKKEGNYYA